MSTPETRRVEVESNLWALRRKLELANERPYTWESIAEATGLNPNTIYSLANNRSRGIRFDTMEALLAFFHREGLEIGPGDLFTMELEES